MIEIREGRLTFSFPRNWQVRKYDHVNFYRNNVLKCPETKAADILALSDRKLFLIEVKDFRNYRIENRGRIRSGELSAEFAQKVRDTVAGLYGAYRSDNQELKDFCTHLFTGKSPKQVMAILLLEEDRPVTNQRDYRLFHDQLHTSIRRQLKFLNIRCNIHGRGDLPAHLGWRVR